MQFFGCPAAELSTRVGAFIFDIDRTLYDNDEYAHGQIDTLIARLARERGEDVSVTAAAIAEWQERWRAEHDGRAQSLGNTFVAFGVPIETSVRWREELVEPERYLHRDDALRDALASLQDRESARPRPLIAVTNNPSVTGRRSLAALGVDDLFVDVIGLDVTMRSKPDPAAFARAIELLGVAPARILSVGDRYDVDIAPPLSLGTCGVLVDGVSDVYRLPELLVGGAS